MSPVELEAKKGHALLSLGNDVYAEVTKYRGRVYVALRRWWKNDEGRWARMHGLSVSADAFKEIVAQAPKLTSFVLKELEAPYESEVSR